MTGDVSLNWSTSSCRTTAAVEPSIRPVGKLKPPHTCVAASSICVLVDTITTFSPRSVDAFSMQRSTSSLVEPCAVLKPLCCGTKEIGPASDAVFCTPQQSTGSKLTRGQSKDHLNIVTVDVHDCDSEVVATIITPLKGQILNAFCNSNAAATMHFQQGRFGLSLNNSAR